MNTRDRSAAVVQLDLGVCLVIALCAFFAIALGAPLILRLPLAASLALFIPGYALLSALMVGRVLSAPEQIMVAITSSVALAIVSGLAMAALGVPIERMTWVYVLTTIALSGLIIAWIRRWQRGIEGPRPGFARTPVRQTALVVIAGLLLANIVAAGRLIASDQFGNPPAELWLVAGSDPYGADLGMRADPDGGTYRLVLSAGSDTLKEFDLTLGPSETWDTQLVLNPEERAVPLVARLYEGDSSSDSRYVVLQPVASNAP